VGWRRHGSLFNSPSACYQLLTGAPFYSGLFFRPHLIEMPDKNSRLKADSLIAPKTGI